MRKYSVFRHSFIWGKVASTSKIFSCVIPPLPVFPTVALTRYFPFASSEIPDAIVLAVLTDMPQCCHNGPVDCQRGSIRPALVVCPESPTAPKHHYSKPRFWLQ